MSEKLEPCPFCGGEASLTIPSEHVQADYADIYVSCDECEVEGQHFVVEMRDRTPDLWPYEQRDAIAAWNTRTPANGEQVERAREAVNALDWDDVYKAARRRALNDATGTFYDDHLAREIADRIAATLPTPTQDARERVKVLEEAARPIVAKLEHSEASFARYRAANPDEQDINGDDAVCVSVADLRTLRTALGNKETDRG